MQREMLSKSNAVRCRIASGLSEAYARIRGKTGRFPHLAEMEKLAKGLARCLLLIDVSLGLRPQKRNQFNEREKLVRGIL